MSLVWHPMGAELASIAPDSLRLVLTGTGVRVSGPLGGQALYDAPRCRREAARLLAAADLLTPRAVDGQLDMFEGVS